jgi:antitoxin (DNA-binding transcriptional repressor) of toxin-antitoxin stability system
MSKTISLDELPRKVERLLRSVWEEHESIILERNGKPVATVAPMEREIQKADGKRRKAQSRKRRAKATAEPSVSSLAYELPADLMAEYERLMNRKFDEGLTPDEEEEFARVAKALSDADIATPLGQAIIRQAQEQHEQWMRRMDKVMETLRTLKESS